MTILSKIDRNKVHEWLIRNKDAKGISAISSNVVKMQDKIAPFDPELNMNSVYGVYLSHYLNTINLCVKNISKSKKNIAILFLMYQYLELYIKEICWNYGDKTFKELKLGNHDLSDILKNNEARIVDELKIHTQEEFLELIEILNILNEYSGAASNSSISFRYPILKDKNDVEMELEKIEEISNEIVINLWERLMILNEWKIVNHIMNHFSDSLETDEENVISSLNSFPIQYQPHFFIVDKNALGLFHNANNFDWYHPKTELPGHFYVQNDIIYACYFNAKVEFDKSNEFKFGMRANVKAGNIGKTYISLTKGTSLFLNGLFDNEQKAKNYINGYMTILFNLSVDQYKISCLEKNKTFLITKNEV